MYKRMYSLLFSHLFFFLICSILILSLNLTPLYRHIRNSPPGRTFSMIHNNAQDFFFYQSLMNQGANGSWLTRDSFTTEPHKPSIIFAYFLWLGKLAKLFSLPYPIMYHAIRILFGFLMLLTAYCLLRKYFPYPRLSFFFFIFAGGFLRPYNAGDAIITVPFMHWWTGMDAIRRASYLPHHMIGSSLLILTFFLLIHYMMRPAWKLLFGALLCIPILAFVHTPSLFIILIVLPPALILFLLRRLFIRRVKFSIFNSQSSLNAQKKNFQSGKNENLDLNENLKLKIENYVGLLGYWVIGVLLLMLMVSQTSQGFPWSQYIEWEKRLQFSLFTELPGALGILFPFALLGIPLALRNGGFAGVLSVCWFLVPILFIPLAPNIGISNIRLVQGVLYLPLSILAVYGMQGIQTLLRKLKIVNYVVPTLFVGLFVYFTIPTLQWSLNDQIREYMPIYGNVYFDNRMQEAFVFINTRYPADTHVLSTFYTGNYLPAFTHTTSFVGHSGYTHHVDQKEKLVQAFFLQQLSDGEAKRLLEEHDITIIFQGPEEKPLYPGKLYPELLDVVYDKEPVTLYSQKE